MFRFFVVSRTVFFLFMTLSFRGMCRGQAAAHLDAPGGLAVCVGVHDEEEILGLVAEGRWLAHVLVRDVAAGHQLRSRLDAYAGLVSVGVLPDDGSLPFAKDSVNAVIVDRSRVDPVLVPDTTLSEILAPGGQFIRKTAGGWKGEEQPQNPAYDDWRYYGANVQNTNANQDTAVAPSGSMRWFSQAQVAGDARSIDGVLMTASKFGLNKDSGGFDFGEGMRGRDMFSGVPLWTVPSNRSGFNNGTRLSSHWRIATPAGFVHLPPGWDQYAQLVDPKTGEILVTYDQGLKGFLKGNRVQGFENRNRQFGTTGVTMAGVMFFFEQEGVLYQLYGRELVALELRSGKRLWSVESDNPMYRGVITTDGSALVVAEVEGVGASGRGRWGEFSPNALVAYELKKDPGTVRWRSDRIATEKVTELIALPNNQILAFNHDNQWAKDRRYGFLTFDSQTGDLLVENIQEVPKRYYSYAPIVTGGSFWTWGSYAKLQKFDYTRSEPAVKHIGLGGNQRCTRPTGSANYILTGFTSYVKLNGDWTQNSIARGSCGEPAFPMYGSVLFITDITCSCYNGLRGVFPLVPTPEVQVIPNAERTNVNGLLTGGAGQDADLPDTVLTKEWPGLSFLSYFDYSEAPQVNVGDITVTVDIQRHRIQASGGATWSWRAGARVWEAPVVMDNRLLVASMDGTLTCLDAGTGEVEWKFLAAPRQEFLVVNGQLESRWPVYNSLVHEGKVYVVAGRHNEVDGGLWAWCLDAEDGSVLKQVRLYSKPDTLKNSQAYTRQEMGDLRRQNDRISWRGTPEVLRHAGLASSGLYVPPKAETFTVAVRVARWHKSGSRPSTSGYFFAKKHEEGRGTTRDVERPFRSPFVIKFDEWDGTTVDPYQVRFDGLAHRKQQGKR